MPLLIGLGEGDGVEVRWSLKLDINAKTKANFGDNGSPYKKLIATLVNLCLQLVIVEAWFK